MDQVGYPGVDENTFVDVAHGRTPAPEGEAAGPGITTGSLGGSPTAGFGKTQQEGAVRGPKVG